MRPITALSRLCGHTRYSIAAMSSINMQADARSHQPDCEALEAARFLSIGQLPVPENRRATGL